MILKLFIALVPIAVVLFVSEYVWRKKIVKGERARKFIHILAGVWMAFWPFYIPFDGIFVLGSIAVTLLIYSRVTRLFHAIYDVKRKTYGDILFAVAIVACAYIGQADWVYTISILFLALADGAAAVVGRFWGITNQYHVFGIKVLKKSVAGTIAFVFFSYVSIFIGALVGGGEIIAANLAVCLILLPVTATFIENITPYGFDNLLTPVTATLILNSLL